MAGAVHKGLENSERVYKRNESLHFEDRREKERSAQEMYLK